MSDNRTIVVLSVASMLILCAVTRMVLSVAHAASEVITIPITLSDSRLDFGTVPLYGSAVREFIVRNDGVEPLHVRLSIERPAFSVSPQEMVLYPGVESRVSVAVTADRPGSLDEELKIRFEGQGIAPLVIALDGEAQAEPAQPKPTSRMLRV